MGPGPTGTQVGPKISKSGTLKVGPKISKSETLKVGPKISKSGTLKVGPKILFLQEHFFVRIIHFYQNAKLISSRYRYFTK